MSRDGFLPGRRRFLKRAAQTGAWLAMPYVIPGTALGKDGVVAPSERIVLGGIGIGDRGTYDLGCFLHEPDARFVAICDVKTEHRKAAKEMVDAKYGNSDCATYVDLRELLARPDIDAVLIATGPNWHALASVLAAQAGKDVYCEKPCTKTIADSLTLAEAFRRTGRVFQAGTQRRSLPNFTYAVELARSGRLGKLQTLYAHPMTLKASASGWLPAQPEVPQEVNWDLYLGPAAWRPFHRDLLRSFDFEEGGGLVGNGCLPWGSHCVDLCQWANNADATAPVEYEPKRRSVARPLRQRRQAGHPQRRLAAAGLVPGAVRGRHGLGGDGRRRARSSRARRPCSPARAPRSPAIPRISTSATSSIVSRRGLRRGPTPTSTCYAHIACHAANIALFLGRKVNYDPEKNEFIGDEEANRLRSEALREPWRL